MPEFEIARYRYQDRMTVLGYVEDALHAADAPLREPSGSVVVIVRVTPPEIADYNPMARIFEAEWNALVDADAARGCPTKVVP